MAAKISFKDEILYILNNYASNPDILRPGFVSTITKRVYTGTQVLDEDTGKQVCLYEKVIQYADNDTQVLPVLYRCLDDQCRENLDSNITSFLTSGSMAWYGFVSNLPDEAVEVTRNKHGQQIRKMIINTKLYRSEKK